jgi:hypothetical protein
MAELAVAETGACPEVLPRGSRVPCDCPRMVDRRPGDPILGRPPGNESITVWHRAGCEGRRPGPVPETWRGELADGEGAEALALWRCEHEHTDPREALRCATGELMQRSRCASRLARKRREGLRHGR